MYVEGMVAKYCTGKVCDIFCISMEEEDYEIIFKVGVLQCMDTVKMTLSIPPCLKCPHVSPF